MRFSEYILKRAKVTNNPRGDFIADARREQEFPDFASWRQLKGYLMLRGADALVLEAGKAAWQSYHNAAVRYWARYSGGR